MENFSIPVRACEYGAGHFRSDATIIVEGAENGCAGYGVGGWTAAASGRLVTGGPMVQGPHAYLYGKSLVLDTRGGTQAINADAERSGNLFRVKSGDVINVAGVAYVVTLCARRYPELQRVR